MRVLIASTNAGKVREVRRIFEAVAGVEIITPRDIALDLDVIEDGDTFADNARKKALEWAEASGGLALADDSGLVVDALGGAPGVYSARYAGEGATDLANNEKVLRSLEEAGAKTPEERSARFVCWLALAAPDGSILHETEGVVEGTIIEEERGAGGFGYDPLFRPRIDGVFGPLTTAELAPEEKDRISHRGSACRAMARWLKENRDALLEG